MLQDFITVLIADDEVPIREQLRAFPWETWGAVLIGEAEDGQEALELCREFKPDVVISDITMPVMNGIELLRRLSKEIPRTKSILLTCHSEFHFAQEGIRLGASDYLVKVMFQPEDLGAALFRIRQQLQRDDIYSFGEEELRKWDTIRRLQDWFRAGGRDTSPLLALLGSESHSLPLPGRLVALHVESRIRERAFVDRELQSILRSAVPPVPWLAGWKVVQTGDYVLQLRQPLADAGWLERELSLWLERMRTRLEEQVSYMNCDMRLAAWIGPVLKSPAEVADMLKKLMDGLQDSFYWADDGVYAGELPEPAVLSADELQRLKDWTAKYETDRVKLLELLRGDWSSHVREMRCDPVAFKRQLLPAALQWCKHLDAPSRDSFAESLEAAHSLKAWVDIVGEALETRQTEPAAGRIEIRQTKQIVEQRLGEPVTLQSIAREVGLTPHYLGKLFRQEVGESFQEYVTRKRIEKAAWLLQTTNAKIYEIAAQVGIASYRYFSIMFREYTGQTPTEFKRG